MDTLQTSTSTNPLVIDPRTGADAPASTIADVLARLESGALGYGAANARRVAAALRKCAVVYEAPLERISACPRAFEARWGRGRVTTFPLGAFNSAAAYRDWRSNVRGALLKLAAAAAKPDDDVVAAWDALLDTFARVSDRRPRELHPHVIASLRQLARIGRSANVMPQDLTVERLVAVRAEMPTTRAKVNLSRAVRRFEALRKDARFAPFMPPSPVGPLPPLRQARSAAFGKLPREVRRQFEAWLTARPLARAPLFGEVKPLSQGYAGQLRGAVKWFVDRAEACGQLDPGAVDEFRKLCRPDWLRIAITHEKTDTPHSLKPRTLKTYVSALLLMFADHGVDVSAFRNDCELRQRGDGLTPANEAFCKKLLRDRRLRQRFFQTPDLLVSRAQAALAADDREGAIAAGVAAVAVKILIAVAPIRISNLAAIRISGPSTTLFLDRAHDHGLLVIPASEAKNKKPFSAPVPPPAGGETGARATIDWFLETIRPLMLEKAEQAGSDWLFPAARGNMCKKRLRDVLKIEMSAIGLPMRPHLFRHAVASLVLDHEPTALVRVAALLGDEPATVVKHYAFLEKVRLVVEAQKTLLDSMARGVGKRS